MWPIGGDAGALPADGDPSTARAGAPGFAFARVAVDGSGAQVVHHRAVDVVSDNRLLPFQAVTTTHRFAASCGTPEVVALLVHRGWPVEMTTLGTPTETVLAEARQ